MVTLDIFEYILPICRGGDRKNDLEFLGSCFFFDENAIIISCKHVIEEFYQSHNLFVKYKNELYEINNIKLHPVMDFFMAKVEISNKNKFFDYSEEINMGCDVLTFGYIFDNKEGGIVNLLPRTLKGHVVRKSPKPPKITQGALTTCELSFPVLEGFSGAPLLSESDFKPKLLGMVYGNIESSIDIHKIDEYTDDQGKIVKDNKYRVIELGLAHTMTDILSFINDINTL